MDKAGTDSQLEETYITTDQGKIYTSLLKAPKPRADHLTAVIMHGAGQADSTRHAGLSAVFAAMGISVISLDFIGHGKTGGSVHDNCLRYRTEHALAVVEHWTAARAPLIICGFSMSGHTALRLAKILGDRVHSLGLFCPATYPAEAEDVHFGPAFTEIIRTPQKWRSSLALQDARAYAAHVAIVAGSKDEVIPWEVTTEIMHALRQQAASLRVEILGGVEHKLGGWLSSHQQFDERLIAYLAGDSQLG